MQAIESFGKYTLLEKIAAGGMAEVYLAKSEGAGGVEKLVAIKRILPQYSDNQDFIDMFKEEAKIAINLNHSNVVSIFDFGIEKNQFFLVMEYVEGQNLRQILNHLKKESKDFTIDQIVYLIKEVAAGLDHAHRCMDSSGRPLNITHRDMSPQNIMVSFEGEVKVVDFGIAKAESQVEQTRAGTIKGKFGYMSPEQAEGLPVDVRTDIFSLGIVLWELLANDRLFIAHSEAATLKKIRDCHIPSLRKVNPTIPPEIERICNKALAKDRSLRYQTAAALHRDLNRFLNTQYPDFTVQDLSVFLKSSFSKLFLENRKKLAAYSKIKSTAKDDKTEITNTETLTESFVESSYDSTEKKSPAVTSTGYTDHVINNPEFQIDPKANHKVSLTNLMRNEQLPAETSQPSYRLRKQEQDLSIGGISGSISSIKSKANQQWNLSWIGPVAIIAAVAYGSWNLWSHDFYGWGPQKIYSRLQQLLPKIEPSPVAKTEPIVEDPHQEGHTDLTSESPPIPFTIYTTPSSAVVYIDGMQEGITPFTGYIRSQQSLKVSLSKNGYLPYDSIIQGTNGRSPMTIRATLQPRPPMGAIGVQVVNGGPATIITVNKQRLSESLPISQYPIPANTIITIEAYDPLTQFSATQKVQVRQDEKKTIKLILTKKTAAIGH